MSIPEVMPTKISIEMLNWLDYEFDLFSSYENGLNTTVKELKSSHSIADNKIGEFLEVIGVNSFSEFKQV